MAVVATDPTQGKREAVNYVVITASASRVEVWEADDAGPLGNAPVKVVRSRLAAYLWIACRYVRRLAR